MKRTIDKFIPGVAPKLNLLADCGFLTFAALMATEGPEHAIRWGPGLGIAALGIATWIAASYVVHQYDPGKVQELLGDLALTAVLGLGAALVMVLPGWLAPAYAPTVTLSHVLASLLPGLLWLRAVMPGVRSVADVPEDVLIVGAGPLARHTGRRVRSEGQRKLLGYLGLPGEEADPRLRSELLGEVGDLEDVLGKRALDEVYIAGHATRQGDAMQRAVEVCERFGTPFALPASEFRFERARPAHPRAIRDGYVHYVTAETKRAQRALMRVFDIAVSSLAIALLSPIFVGVALAIKLTSRGPVLFKQERVGLHGRPFHMLKFRSMVVDAEKLRAALEAQNEQSGPVFKIKKDPRITAVGRVIRKLSVDELPQFINVLRGEMAIVGPRPPLPSEVAKYEPWQRRRLSVRPGITCVWQVSGRSEISFEQWMYLDMQYIDHWSLRKDLKLILMTLPAVLKSRGAS
jgi:exopolysaccharide biosynthesis polyprenyl glycosylphosphotransferase